MCFYVFLCVSLFLGVAYGARGYEFDGQPTLSAGHLDQITIHI